MEVLALKLSEKKPKVLNWFKYERRKEIRKGKMKYEVNKIKESFLKLI